MRLPGPVRDAFRMQAEACQRLGSPFTAHLCRRLPELLDPETRIGRRVADWRLHPAESALALRICGVLHRAVRSGLAPGLAQFYPPAPMDGPALDAALSAFLRSAGDQVLGWLDSAPQTNEVARSGVLLGGMLHIAAETGLPLSLFEIGSSAGLNLHADCYTYDLGATGRWGSPSAPLTILCDWRGRVPPLDAPLQVAARAGSDIAPLDPADAEARERMLGYLWPDQPTRMARAETALAHAAAHPASVDHAEAADWVEARLSEPSPRGQARVLMHSIMWQYLPQPTQARVAAAMHSAGAAAHRDSPLAWLRLEPDGDPSTAAVLLTLWPGGTTRELGRGDWHGRFVDWAGSPRIVA